MTQPTPANAAGYYPMIDVLRGFAAISVVVYHVIELLHWTEFPVTGPLVWFRIGGFGVDLFFVISGLVVSLSAFAMIDDGRASFAATFMRRRLARIVPLYYATALAFTLFIVPHFFFQADFWPNAVAHALFVHNLSPDMAGSMDGVNWSVGVEMQFYLLIVLLAPVLRTCRWWLIPAVAVPVAWAWRLGAVDLVPAVPSQGLASLFWATTQLPGTLDEFALGILLARLLRDGWPSRAVAAPALTWLFTWTPMLVAPLLLWVTFAVFWRHPTFWDTPWMVVAWRSLCGLAWAALVLAVCRVQSQRLVQLVAPLRYLGTISYGIYLWHLLVISSLQRLPWLTAERAFPVVLILTFLLAAASWHLFERPALQRFARSSSGQHPDTKNVVRHNFVTDAC